MKKEVTIEQSFCDHCGKSCDYPSTCLHCGTEHCYDCSDTYGVDYKHDVWASGSGDGYYCIMCDAKLRASGDNPLHSAYLLVACLREEATRIDTDFRKRCDKAVKELQRCRQGGMT